ncbi:MAG: hypothetical protein QOI20_2100 [Acidimicrobiaceae bacterium]|nr:hypothetical protein [Acidimicrobiaceae bacterium]
MAEKRLVGVYRDDADADRAVQAAERVGATNVVRGGRSDHVASLQDEMREQMEHTFVGPGNVGPFTKEMSKGIARWTPAVTIALMVLAAPLAAMHMGRLGLPTRLAIVEACALATGATIGFLAGMMKGGKGVDRREDPLAAERGVVVGVTVDEAAADEVADAMAQAGPIRLDVSGTDGRPLSTLATEEDPG